MFDKIDDYLREKKPSEVTLIGFIAIALIVFLIFTYLFGPSERFLNNNKRELANITKKLNDEIIYLASMKQNNDQNFHVKRLQREIKDIQANFQERKELNNYVDKKLKDLSYLLFNDKNWSNFLDRISALAKKNKLKIVEISNQFNKPTLQKIEQILIVHVESLGGYEGTMNFINEIEESRLIVDISELTIEGKRKIATDMNISVWGMRY